MDAEELERLRLLAAAFEHTPVMLGVVAGPDLRMMALNASARALVGDPGAGATLDGWPGLDRQELEERCREVLETGRRFVSRERRVDPAPRGGPHAEVYLDIMLSPLVGEDGSVRAVVGTARDVSARVRARRAAGSPATESAQRQHVSAELLVELQDALLPKGLPVPQGAQLAARYVLAEDRTATGGDWFDAIPLADGRVVTLAGDVVGHGLEASVVMGELKTLFEERVRQDGDLVAALELLDQRAVREPAARAATVCATALDPASGALAYCTAGHPPPLVVAAASGRASFLPASGAGPLGSGLPFTVVDHRLEVGDLLLLYSDGLVERPGASRNSLELARVAEEAFRGARPARGAGEEQVVDRVCRHTVEVMTQLLGHRDDIVVLAMQRVPPVAPLDVVFPTFPDTLRVVRAEVEDWLAPLHVSVLDQVAVQHAVGELVSNVIEHAYPGRAGKDRPVCLTAELLPDGFVRLGVTDQGRWRHESPSPGRGRGLAMVTGFMDHFMFEHDGSGSRATIRHRLSRPAPVLMGRQGAPARAATGAFALTREDAFVHVTGIVDDRSAGELRRGIATATRGGTAGVVVDLGGVTMLASAGVQVLYEELAAGGLPSVVRLVAPMGSPAQHVLDVVRLPYQTELPSRI